MVGNDYFHTFYTIYVSPWRQDAPSDKETWPVEVNNASTKLGQS